MDEQRRHLVIGVRDERVLPQDDGTQHWTVGKTEADGEEGATQVGGDTDDLGQPHVDQDEQVGEVAEVQQEELEVELGVRVDAIGHQEDGFLGEKSVGGDT